MTSTSSFVLVLMGFVFTTAWAQRSENAARPRWGDHYQPSLGHATAAERAAAMTTLDELQRVLEQAP